MGNAGLLNRALPFLATFGLGLFVASFFVNISPRFEHHERGRCHRDMWEMRIENEQLREENKRLRESQDSSRVYPVLPPVNLENDEFDLPSIPTIGEPVPVTPPPVKAHKVIVK